MSQSQGPKHTAPTVEIAKLKDELVASLEEATPASSPLPQSAGLPAHQHMRHETTPAAACAAARECTSA